MSATTARPYKKMSKYHQSKIGPSKNNNKIKVINNTPMV